MIMSCMMASTHVVCRSHILATAQSTLSVKLLTLRHILKREKKPLLCQTIIFTLHYMKTKLRCIILHYKIMVSIDLIV